MQYKYRVTFCEGYTPSAVFVVYELYCALRDAPAAVPEQLGISDSVRFSWETGQFCLEKQLVWVSLFLCPLLFLQAACFYGQEGALVNVRKKLQIRRGPECETAELPTRDAVQSF